MCSNLSCNLLFHPLPKTHHPLGYILLFLLHSSFCKPLNEPKIVYSHILPPPSAQRSPILLPAIYPPCLLSIPAQSWIIESPSCVSFLAVQPADPPVIPLQGRLRACWPEWAKLKPNALVSSIILNGYTLTWATGPPPPMWHKNGPRTYLHPELVTSQLSKVHSLGVLKICSCKDLHCILALDLLPKPDSTWRLILNGHPLVDYEAKRPFKMESLHR